MRKESTILLGKNQVPILGKSRNRFYYQLKQIFVNMLSVLPKLHYFFVKILK